MYCDNFSVLAQLLVSLELMSSFLFCLILNTNSTPNSAKSSNLPRGIPVYQVFYHLEIDSAFSAGAQPAVWDHHTSTLKSPSSFAPRQDPLLPMTSSFLLSSPCLVEHTKQLPEKGCRDVNFLRPYRSENIFLLPSLLMVWLSIAFWLRKHLTSELRDFIHRLPAVRSLRSF